MKRIGDEERRARLATRHHLAHPAAAVEQVAGDLVGLHSSDPGTVYLSLRARMNVFEAADLEDALYERRTLVRMLGMRRTLFVVPFDLAVVMDAACARALAPGQRRRVARLVEEQGIDPDGGAWVERVMAATLAALDERGEATARELVAVVPELAEQITFGEGRDWGGTYGMSTRILFLLAAEARIVRTRPLGSWVSGQYRWAPISAWIPGGLDVVPAREARAELTRRWLRTFGPGTEIDLKWWTGWGIGDTRAALSAVRALEVEVDHGPAYLAPDDLETAPPIEGRPALLPSLDPTVMGWKERDFYLGDHDRWLFDRNGNAGPTVWWKGRVVGGWAQRRSGEVVFRLLEDVGSEATAAVESEAARLEAWLGAVRITPRFRTPLDRELDS